ncbi:MAG: SIS domain-containing protein [Lentisphaeria bacterium]|nr:SIS domain-containing protein [Lentisphaeria bacterium]
MFADISSERHIKELIVRYPQLAEAAESIDQVYITLKTCFVNDKTLFCAGNGGSGADSEHIAGELLKGFLLRRPLDYQSVGRILRTSGDRQLADRLQMGLRCISLLSHPALNTAFMNDVDPNLIFAQQLFVLGRSGDAVLGISTSGNAVNICNLFKVARSKQITTILLTGSGHGAAEKFADQVIHVPEKETFKVQELHLPVYHCLCAMLEDNFYGK